MLSNRIDFHNVLKGMFPEGKEPHVYFQPPENIQMEYPCIVYRRHDINNISANNNVYGQGTSYQVVVIDKNPDSDIVYNVSKYPTARFNRHYTASELNHDVFTIIYK